MERFADVIDRAQAHVEMETTLRIDQIRRRAVVVGVGSPHCIDCGCRIPEGRRKCMQSTQRCVACQSLLERAR
jgi:phage/conjugal plasmid C-4 type zinc finger TraR family protein